jgi:hypothetical protein
MDIFLKELTRIEILNEQIEQLFNELNLNLNFDNYEKN